MIDTLGILVSTISVLYVLVRARALDRTLPWFESEPSRPESRAADRDGQAFPQRVKRR